jgi:hypothetical protein
MTINESAKNSKETVTFNSQYPLTLLAMNTAGKIDTRRATGKLYGC